MKLRAFYLLFFLAGFWAVSAHPSNPSQNAIPGRISPPVQWLSGGRLQSPSSAAINEHGGRAIDDVSTRNLSEMRGIGSRAPTARDRKPRFVIAQARTAHSSNPLQYILCSSYRI